MRLDVDVPSEFVFSLAALESKLVAYVKDPAAAAEAFDVSSVPKISRAQAAAGAAHKYFLFGTVVYPQDQVRWTSLARHCPRKWPMPPQLLRRQRSNRHMPSSFQRSPNSLHMVPSLTAVPHLPNSPKMRPSTRLTVSSIFSKKISFSRYVNCCVRRFLGVLTIWTVQYLKHHTGYCIGTSLCYNGAPDRGLRSC